ncbi:hypothetical protein T484DRAFT_1834884 [Baffinella frigidus]|nr:hypothetical protein T484DRAFT_1834884 [Cryptophyta sp. CCMP2293]
MSRAPNTGPGLLEMNGEAAGNGGQARVLRMRWVAKKNGMVRLFSPGRPAAVLPLAEAPSEETAPADASGSVVKHAPNEPQLPEKEWQGGVAPDEREAGSEGGGDGSPTEEPQPEWSPPDRSTTPTWAHEADLNEPGALGGAGDSAAGGNATTPGESRGGGTEGRALGGEEAEAALQAPAPAPSPTAAPPPTGPPQAPPATIPPSAPRVASPGSVSSLAGEDAQWRDPTALAGELAVAVAGLTRLEKRLDAGGTPWRDSVEDGPKALQAEAGAAARSMAVFIWRGAALVWWAAVLGVRTILWAAVWAIDYASAREFWVPEAAEKAEILWKSYDTQRAKGVEERAERLWNSYDTQHAKVVLKWAWAEAISAAVTLATWLRAVVKWAWAEAISAAVTLATWLSRSLSPELRDKARAAATAASQLAGEAGRTFESVYSASPETDASRGVGSALDGAQGDAPVGKRKKSTAGLADARGAAPDVQGVAGVGKGKTSAAPSNAGAQPSGSRTLRRIGQVSPDKDVERASRQQAADDAAEDWPGSRTLRRMGQVGADASQQLVGANASQRLVSRTVKVAGAGFENVGGNVALGLGTVGATISGAFNQTSGAISGWFSQIQIGGLFTEVGVNNNNVLGAISDFSQGFANTTGAALAGLWGGVGARLDVVDAGLMGIVDRVEKQAVEMISPATIFFIALEPEVRVEEQAVEIISRSAFLMPFFKEVEFQVKGNEMGMRMYLQVQRYLTRAFFWFHPKWDALEQAFRRTLFPEFLPCITPILDNWTSRFHPKWDALEQAFRRTLFPEFLQRVKLNIVFYRELYLRWTVALCVGEALFVSFFNALVLASLAGISAAIVRSNILENSAVGGQTAKQAGDT